MIEKKVYIENEINIDLYITISLKHVIYIRSRLFLQEKVKKY